MPTTTTAAVLLRHGGPDALEVRDDWQVHDPGPGGGDAAGVVTGTGSAKDAHLIGRTVLVDPVIYRDGPRTLHRSATWEARSTVVSPATWWWPRTTCTTSATPPRRGGAGLPTRGLRHGDQDAGSRRGQPQRHRSGDRGVRWGGGRAGPAGSCAGCHGRRCHDLGQGGCRDAGGRCCATTVASPHRSVRSPRRG